MLSLAVRAVWLVGRWRRDRCGVAAIEFAMILPVMLVFYIGAVDVTRGVLASRKVELVSRTIADLVGQQPTTTTTSTSTLATIFTASAVVMDPFPTTGMTMTVSAVTIQAKSNGQCCDAKVNWSYTQSGTLRQCRAMLTQVSAGTPADPTNIQSNLITANQQAGFVYSSTKVSYLIIADVTYAYQPLLPQTASWFASGFRKTSYMVPRSINGQVTLTNTNSAGTGQSGVICP